MSSGGFGNGLLLNNYCVIAAPSRRGFLAHLTILHFASETFFATAQLESAANVSLCFLAEQPSAA